MVLSDAPNNDVEAGKPNLDYVVGVSSFAPETCGQRTLPGVYTRVSMFSGWIAETIAKMSEVRHWDASLDDCYMLDKVNKGSTLSSKCPTMHCYELSEGFGLPHETCIYGGYGDF